MKRLLYPSAGTSDWKIAYSQFSDSVDEFIFADLYYKSSDIIKFKKYLTNTVEIVSVEEVGSFENEIAQKQYDDIKYNDISPASCIFIVKDNGVAKTIIFRKGYGQFALRKLDDKSLYCFYHRGDSGGEGGSNVFYLGNRNAEYKPLSRLFDQLIKKLTDNALIVTDGSNLDLKHLKKVYKKVKLIDKSSVIEAKESVLGTVIETYGVQLKCIDVLDYRYNHTLVWEVSKNL